MCTSTLIENIFSCTDCYDTESSERAELQWEADTCQRITLQMSQLNIQLPTVILHALADRCET